MAIGVTHHTTSGTNTDGTSAATASIMPAANVLLIACYDAFNATESVDPTAATAAGLSLTWSAVDTFVWRQFGDRARKTIFAADTGASPGSGAITFTQGSAQTCERFVWSVFEASGTDLASSGGSSTVAQCFIQFVHSTVNASGTSTTVTLASAGSPNNRPFLSVCNLTNSVINERTNWTEIGDAGITDTFRTESQWRSDIFEATTSASWASTVGYGATAFEVKALAAGGGATATSRTLLGVGV